MNELSQDLHAVVREDNGRRSIWMFSEGAV